MEKYNSPNYMNKTDLLYRLKPGEELEVKWNELLEYRKQEAVELPLIDQKGKNIFVVLSKELKERIALIDDLAKKNIFEELDEEVKRNVVIDAQTDEAFYSSVIEGAHTTKKRTKQMIENEVKPKNKDEKMVFNNYQALFYILGNIGEAISEEVLLRIYNIVTNETLDKDEIVNKYRLDQNEVRNLEAVIYVPPEAEKVQEMMDSLFEFMSKDDDERIHPILKAVIFHYYFVYVHPFYDGNGRTARALTYMYLLQNGYDFFKYFSISNIISEARGSYYKAIKNSEDYESDVTYFALFYTKMILDSIKKVTGDFKKQYLKKVIYSEIEHRGLSINDRQEKLIDKVIKFDKSFIDAAFYIKLNKVSQETARKDLSDLVEMEIFSKKKVGRKFHYIIKNNQ